MGWTFEAWNEVKCAQVEAALAQWVPEQAPADLGQAMRYAVLGGGKRLRPLLAMAACESVQGDAHAALRAGCAAELIHAYSLVHDDMPCMDNDVLRRGKPTVHVKFGQASALLAGDALQALAFELLTPQDGSVSAAVQAQLCGLLARAAGEAGMAGGQAIDLASIGQQLSQAQLRRMHELKTGALLQASVMMGAACGNASKVQLTALQSYGQAIGLAFQVVDDILDVTADSATLGKTAGKDALAGKPTYVSILGMQPSQDLAKHLHLQALAALKTGELQQTQALHALADWVVARAY
ncbi:MAG: polyprenyl synthetase family protein [Brachymonas sp.]|nr:polyprenyl synthetase family protein [Brachymonas sp.]